MYWNAPPVGHRTNYRADRLIGKVKTDELWSNYRNVGAYVAWMTGTFFGSILDPWHRFGDKSVPETGPLNSYPRSVISNNIGVNHRPLLPLWNEIHPVGSSFCGKFLPAFTRTWTCVDLLIVVNWKCTRMRTLESHSGSLVVLSTSKIEPFSMKSNWRVPKIETSY